MSIPRRTFLQGAAVLAAGAVTPARAQPSERIQAACIGVGGRAAGLMHATAAMRDVDLVALCDLDSRKLPDAVAAVEKLQGKKPRTETDFRRLLDDKGIDVLIVGTPDHWHAIPTIMGCQAGKDVYVEKPDGHNIVEGQRMVEAMRRYGRIVQMGTQSRTAQRFHDAMAYIRSGKLGKARFAKAWESGKQGSIGRPPDGEPPAGVDYDMWLGPAPKRPFNPVRFHGNWRWFFDYGTGDLGNDGVHRLDVARWALSTAAEAMGEPALTYPVSVSATGGKWYFDDMQEWPDTLQVDFEYPGKVLTYEMRIWAPYNYHGQPEGAVVYGDQGYIVIGNSRWQAFAPDGKVTAEGSGADATSEHIRNFLECVKSRKKPNADLETVGQVSSFMCHAGNVAWRTGKRLKIDEKTLTFDDREANALRTRAEYRAPWRLPRV